MKTKRARGRGPTLDEWLSEEMKDPEFRKGYAQAGIELRAALEAAELQTPSSRKKAGLRQKGSKAALKAGRKPDQGKGKEVSPVDRDVVRGLRADAGFAEAYFAELAKLPRNLRLKLLHSLKAASEAEKGNPPRRA